MNTKIFIATHKEANFPNIEGYIPIQVGAALHDNLGYLSDDKGNNISKKNLNYCELTGLYYIWKNEKCDVVGLTHYRRYFFKSVLGTKLKDVLSINKINSVLDKYDVIMPKKDCFKVTIKEQYKKIHNTEDLDKCGEIIKKKYPKYYDSYVKVMNSKSMYCYNMFIMKKEYFDKYMEWLFSILFELEKNIDISGYDKYNQRIFGFLSERLFNVWLDKENLKIKEYPVYNIEESKVKQIKGILKNFIKRIGG